MIRITILSPEWSRTLEDVQAVFLPGALGEFEVLENHAPIVSILAEGKLRWRSAGAEQSMPIKGGVVSLEKNEMKICIEG